MTYNERKEKEKYLLYLLEENRLNSLENVAIKFNCSTRTVKRMIASLREEGYDIYYCRARYKYYIKA